MDALGAIWKCTISISGTLLVGACTGAIALPLTVGIILPLIGFATRGIVGGSPAARMMAYHEGYVPIDGFVARMQSRGERGYTVVLGALAGLALNGYEAIYLNHLCSGDGPE
ncbi:MAG: hypothetical protein BYD32DRAFT_408657 [Podila humilis]|nr:MAG: hypothetical protein BYD32DRAFT_408657 [Podila humilis]